MTEAAKLAARCTHPRIHLEYYDWLKNMKPDEKHFLDKRVNFETWHAIAMLAWSRSREVMSEGKAWKTNPAWIELSGPPEAADKPTTDNWTDLCGDLKSDTDTHIEMLSDLPPDGPDSQERYELRRMLFISLRQFFRETSIEELARLKESA